MCARHLVVLVGEAALLQDRREPTALFEQAVGGSAVEIQRRAVSGLALPAISRMSFDVRVSLPAGP